MSPDFKVHDPKGWCGDPRRGAALGRGSYHVDEPEEFAGKLYVKRVKLLGDYDSNGTYWGGGRGTQPLYWVASDDQEIDFCLRASSRDEAKRQVLKQYPKARFFR